MVWLEVFIDGGNQEGQLNIKKFFEYERTKTTGVILCEHIKALDLNTRNYQEVEKLPEDIMEDAINIVYSEIEKI